MNLIIKINLDNDAFQYETDDGHDELERILRVVQQKLKTVECPPFEQKIFDINGNPVGTLKLEE